VNVQESEAAAEVPQVITIHLAFGAQGETRNKKVEEKTGLLK